MGAPGPRLIPSVIQRIIKTVPVTNIQIEYGIIIAVSEPIPKSFCQRWAKIRTKGK